MLVGMIFRETSLVGNLRCRIVLITPAVAMSHTMSNVFRRKTDPFFQSDIHTMTMSYE
jgi:hypothetical protein